MSELVYRKPCEHGSMGRHYPDAEPGFDGYKDWHEFARAALVAARKWEKENDA